MMSGSIRKYQQFFDLELFQIGYLTIALSYIYIGLVLLPIRRLGGASVGGHNEPPRINHLQQADP